MSETKLQSSSSSSLPITPIINSNVINAPLTVNPAVLPDLNSTTNVKSGDLIHHDFYRHTQLSWARLRTKDRSRKQTVKHVTNIEPFIKENPTKIPLKDEMRIQKVKRCLSYFAIIAIVGSLVTAGLVISVISLIFSIQQKVPTGTIILYGGSISHLIENDHQWLFCNGSEVSRSAYRRLFLIIGTTYGVGNGIDTFNLPDFRYRFPLGSSNFVNDTLSSGGTEYHNLTVAELPPHDHNQGSLVTVADGVHSHTYNDPGHNHGGSTGLASYIANGAGVPIVIGGGVSLGNSHSHTIPNGPTNIVIQNSGSHTHTITGSTGLTGQNRPISKMPPYQTVHYIIRI